MNAFDEVYGGSGYRLQRKPNYMVHHVKQITEDPELALPSVKNLKKLFHSHYETLRNLSPDAKVRLVDIKYTHVGRFDPINYHRLELPFLLKRIRSAGGMIIHIIRRNLLETYVSASIAKMNNSYRAPHRDLVNRRRINLEPTETLKTLEQRDDEIIFFRKVLGNDKSVIEIYYEDMIEDGMFSATILKDLAKRWSIDPALFDRQPKIEKIAPPLVHAVDNFDQIRETLKSTRFAWMTD